MTYWLLIPLFGLLAVLQATLVPLVAIGGFKVDLPLLVVVAWGLLSAPGEAALWGLLIGAFLDITSGLPFGTQTLALGAIGLLMGLVQSTIFHSNVILPPAAMVLATIGYNLLVLAILYTLNWQITWTDYVIRIILPSALLNTLALPIVYFPLQRLHRMFYPKIEW